MRKVAFWIALIIVIAAVVGALYVRPPPAFTQTPVSYKDPTCAMEGDTFQCVADLDGNGLGQTISGYIATNSGYAIIKERNGSLRKKICWSIGGAVACPIFSALPAFAHDYDGDGKSDILWRQNTGGVAIWEMNGGAVKASLGVGFAGTDWTIVGTASNVLGSGDFNGDGNADILWRQNTGGVALWTMNGNTVTGSFGIAAVGNEWTIAGVCDFDGDGKADILWRQNSGGVAIWLMNGNAVKSSIGVGFAGNEWTIVGVGDFDGDGKCDILWRQNSGGVAIWEMNGGAVKASLGVGFAGNDWTIVGVGDFNGDGKADILWRQNTGGIALWTMNGGTVIGSFGIGFAGVDWQVASVGDYDNDGKADLLWRQDSGGIALWEMNGNVVKASLGVGFAGTEWTIIE